ncbi:alpha/beta fold hydrolase [Imhoffiella purpurea]|uniref:2-succinyl-6-hydroxy-2, 4-cyclohexadiene-1-carboxylate synthase n=1 Tax=Imhoffiella purpurea TaxID=1249627 RepID=W9VSR7_9GAMM|nr:alpha/beta fold hydrolase [Imhoffiella purpurea]EXJ13405.1 2-succinyl-6-hydroxy-2,4-cyclohexadiene-1-carboxylate synthase [Imhoffiella purpurea]
MPRTLLLHGFTGCAEDWESCLPEDASRIAIDLPGHREAPDPTGSFAEEIGRLLDAIPPSIDTLIGYSQGGRIALGLIQAAPDRFGSATIISSHPGLTDPDLKRQRRAADQIWIRLLRNEGMEPFVHAWERQPLFASQSVLHPAALERQRRIRLTHRPEGLAHCLTSLGLGEMPSTWDALARYRGDLTWIVGGEDRKFVQIARQVAELRPSTRVRLIEGIGHNPLLEAPERLNRLLSA